MGPRGGAPRRCPSRSVSTHRPANGRRATTPPWRHADTGHHAGQRAAPRHASPWRPGSLPGLALVTGLQVLAQPAVGRRRGDLPGQDLVHLLADRHLYAVALSQFLHGEGGADALRYGPGAPEYLVERPASAELLAERPVAAQRAHAGGDEVTHAGKAGEGCRLAVHRDAKPGEFGQAT